MSAFIMYHLKDLREIQIIKSNGLLIRHIQMSIA